MKQILVERDILLSTKYNRTIQQPCIGQKNIFEITGTIDEKAFALSTTLFRIGLKQVF